MGQFNLNQLESAPAFSFCLHFSRILFMYFLADRILEQEAIHMKTLEVYYVVFFKVALFEN